MADRKRVYSRTWGQWARGVLTVALISTIAGVILGAGGAILWNTLIGYIRKSTDIGAGTGSVTAAIGGAFVLGFGTAGLWAWLSRPRVLPERATGTGGNTEGAQFWTGDLDDADDSAPDNGETVVSTGESDDKSSGEPVDERVLPRRVHGRHRLVAADRGRQ